MKLNNIIYLTYYVQSIIISTGNLKIINIFYVLYIIKKFETMCILQLQHLNVG